MKQVLHFAKTKDLNDWTSCNERAKAWKNRTVLCWRSMTDTEH